MKSNLILIGMPGCGKSTCGVLAAKALCKSFVDTDLLLQTRAKMGLQEIIERQGEAAFAALEEEVLCDFNENDTVVATGGSAVYSAAGMEHLKENGRVVYLKISYDEMLLRISNIKTRGILLKPGETMEEMFARREHLYESYADVVIDCNGQAVEDTVGKLVLALSDL